MGQFHVCSSSYISTSKTIFLPSLKLFTINVASQLLFHGVTK
jgi:hypothetical protein